MNFEYRGFDTLGEEFILFISAIGVSTVLRHLRGERERPLRNEVLDRDHSMSTDAIRLAALSFAGPVVVLGWFLATHAQTSPSGGFQGGVVLASAFMLIYLAGQFLTFRRISPVDLTDAVEATAAGGFAVVGVAALAMGLPYLANFLPLGGTPGAVSSSGTIALISFLVGVEVAAAFVADHERDAGADAAGLRREQPVMQIFPFIVVALDPGGRAVRHRHQPEPGAPDHVPDRCPVVDLCPAAGRRLPARRRRAVLLRHRVCTPRPWTRSSRRLP